MLRAGLEAKIAELDLTSDDADSDGGIALEGASKTSGGILRGAAAALAQGPVDLGTLDSQDP